MRSVVLFLIVFIFGFAQAKQITERKAYSIASKYFPSGIVSENSLQMSNKQKKSSQGAEFFIFNQVDKSGYIIVSGDDQMPEVVGYSEQGNIDADNMPDNMKSWLEGYAAYVREIRKTASANVIRPIMSLGQPVVSPLVTTYWGQGAPYDKMTPEYSVGKHCPTGCAATALAQVMKYYEWPVKGMGSHSYECEGFGTISSDFSSHTYDWKNMLSEYNMYYDIEGNLIEEWTSVQADAVSLLMKDCGVALDMQYRQNESGAVTGTIVLTGPEFFNYNVETVERGGYRTAEYKKVMKEYLDNRCPLLYRGNGTGGGHAFVVDGYDSNDYFHINWGWNGMSDGYFDINYMNPSSLGTGGGSGGFVMSQAFYVLTPNKSSAPAHSDSYMSYGSISTSDYTATKGLYEGITVTNQFLSGPAQKEVNLGIGIFTENFELISADLYTTVDLESNYGYRNLENLPVNLSELSNGTYFLYPVYTFGDNKEWRRNLCSTDYVKAVVSGNNVTFSDPYVDLVVKHKPSVESERLMINRNASFKISVANVSDFAVSGNLVCGLRQYGTATNIGNFEIPVVLFDDFEFETTVKIFLDSRYITLGVEYELYVKHFEDEDKNVITVSGTDNTCRFIVEDEYNEQPNALTFYDYGDSMFGLSMDIDKFNKSDKVSLNATYLLNPQNEDWSGYFAFGLFDYSGNLVSASDTYGVYTLAPNVVYGTITFQDLNLYMTSLEDGTYYLHMLTNRLVNGEAAGWIRLAYDDYIKIVIKDGVAYVNEYSGVEEIEDSKVEVTVTPNPTTDYVEVRCDEVVRKVNVYAFDGRLVKTVTGANRFDVSDLQSGYYLLGIETEKKVHMAKMIKK